MSADKKESRIKALKIRNELPFRNEKDCQIRQKVLKLLSGINVDSLFFICPWAARQIRSK